MKSTNFEKFDKLCSELSEAKNAVRNHCHNILKKICDRTESKVINLDKLKNFLYDEGLATPLLRRKSCADR